MNSRAEQAEGALLALDPGKTMGWALFSSGKLVVSGYCSREELVRGEVGVRAKRHALPPEVLPEPARLIGEMPTYRGFGEEKATPQDLIVLALQLGQAVGLYMRKVQVVEFVTPNEWKGSLPKDICHSRIEKLLDSTEIFPTNHNARDAVGIGLWKLGRYRR